MNTNRAQQRIGVEHFVENEDAVIFDVRSPAEFAKGHIPGAVNLPVFSDEERAKVGTLYKHAGQKEATLLGLEIAGAKLRSLVEQAEVLAGGKRIAHVHCWRGGNRSGSVAWLLAFNGFHVRVLEGGYKAYRRKAIELFSRPWKHVIVGGYTGSGKTELLHQLQSMGEQVVDLEALAHHKGSAFGSIGMQPQPTQEQFENNIARHMWTFDENEPVWFEDESYKIGQRCWPQDLWKQRRDAPVLFCSVPRKQRIDFLVAGYGNASTSELRRSLGGIQDRLGGMRFAEAVDALDQGDLERVVEIVLDYYDQSYAFGLSKNDKKNVYVREYADLSSIETAQDVLHVVNQNLYPAHG